MMMGNHRTSSTFTMQQLGKWVVHTLQSGFQPSWSLLCYLEETMSLWILFMSQHFNPPSALSDHRASVAWLISRGPHSAAYCYKLGPDGVKAECLCLQKAATTVDLLPW